MQKYEEISKTLRAAKEEGTKAYTWYDSIYMKFKDRQNKSMVVGVRRVIGTDLEGGSSKFSGVLEIFNSLISF